MSATFTHSQSKITTRWWLRILFATVSMQQKGFFCINVTMDKTWIHRFTLDETWIHHFTLDETGIYHFTLESNQQSDEWTAAAQSCPKWPKMQTSAGKVLASGFWDAQGILFMDYLEKGRTINSEYYIAFLVCLKKEIVKK